MKIIKWCLILSLIGNSMTYIFKSLHVLFFARLLCAFGSPMQTLLRTAAADLMTLAAGSDIFNKIGAILSTCFMVGAVISGFLSEYTYGFDLVFLTICLNLVISFAFGSPMQTLLRTAAADLMTLAAGSDIFNKIGAILSTCFMVGVVISGFLSEYTYGFDLVFLTICLNLVISFVLVYLLPKETSKEEFQEPPRRSYVFEKIHIMYRSMKVLKWSHYYEIFVIKGLLDLSYGLMHMNMGLVLLNHFHIEGRYMGFIFCLVGVISVLTNLILTKLNKTVYKEDMGYLRILHGCSLLGISYLGLGLSSVYYIFLCFIVTMFISRTVLDSTLFELLSKKVSDNEKGIVLSLFDVVLSLSELISPILSSVFVFIYGEKSTLLLCSIPAAIGATIAYKNTNSIKFKIE